MPAAEVPLAPPTPAPAPPPTTPSAPAAAPDASRHSSAHLDKAFDLLEDFAPKQPEAPKPPKTAPEPPAPGDDADNAPPPAETKPPTPPEPKIKAKSLREAYDNMKAELAKVRAENEKIGKQPIDLKNHPEVVKLTEQLRKAEERAQEREEELRYSNYERSEEYKTKWLQPYLDAYSEGQQFVQQLQVEGAEGQYRDGKAEDFDVAVAAYLRDPKEGIRTINDLFGDQAAGVLYHAKEVQKLLSARRRAEEDYRKNGAEREKSRTEHQSNMAKQRREMYENEKNTAIDKYPQWFKPVEGDEDGNRLLERGREQADAAFGAGKLRDPKTGEWVQMSEEQMVKLHAAIHNRASAFPRAIHWLKQKDVRIKELETRLKEYEASEPGPGEPRTAPKEANGSLWDRVEAELQKRAK